MIGDAASEAFGGLRGRAWAALRGDAFFYEWLSDRSSWQVEATALCILSSSLFAAGVGISIQAEWRTVAMLAAAWSISVIAVIPLLLSLVSGFFGGSAGWRTMSRVVGYSSLPQALGIVPIAGFAIGALVGVVWAIWCTVRAVRAAASIPTGAAVLTIAILGLIAVGLAPLLVVAASS